MDRSTTSSLRSFRKIFFAAALIVGAFAHGSFASAPRGFAGMDKSFFLGTDGSLWSAGWNGSGDLGDGTRSERSKPVRILSDVASVSTGSEATFFLKTDGTVWACGSNSDGELGITLYSGARNHSREIISLPVILH
jgi:alpha-tubulin suppressor-like RCC1 family protein